MSADYMTYHPPPGTPAYKVPGGAADAPKERLFALRGTDGPKETGGGG